VLFLTLCLETETDCLVTQVYQHFISWYTFHKKENNRDFLCESISRSGVLLYMCREGDSASRFTECLETPEVRSQFQKVPLFNTTSYYALYTPAANTQHKMKQIYASKIEVRHGRYATQFISKRLHQKIGCLFLCLRRLTRFFSVERARFLKLI